MNVNDLQDTLATISELEAILHKERAAIDARDLALLAQYDSEKIRLGAILEQKFAENPKAISKEQLRDLKMLIQRGSEHLQQALHATTEIINEVSRVRDRHGVADLYGRSGTKRGANATSSRAVDEAF